MQICHIYMECLGLTSTYSDQRPGDPSLIFHDPPGALVPLFAAKGGPNTRRGGETRFDLLVP